MKTETKTKTEAAFLLESYRARIDVALQGLVKGLGEVEPVREACGYALMNGGKRIRPAIALMVADALGQGRDVMGVALAVELFHTASLVADDLPCMDDDDERRDSPAAHKKFGEAMALLVTYALIAEGYGLIAQNSSADRVVSEVLKSAARNTGVRGLVGGQFLDLLPPDLSQETLCRVVRMKTGALFELAFVGGWLFGGGGFARLDEVKRAADCFGLAFQIADDFDDVDQDASNERKVNFFAVLGKEKARSFFCEQLAGYRGALVELGVDSPALKGLAVLLEREASLA